MNARSLLLLATFVGAAFGGCFADPPSEGPPSTAAPSTPAPYRAFLPTGGTLAPANGSPAPDGVTTPVNFIATPATGPANELTIAVNPQNPLNLIAGGKDYFLGRDHPCVTQPSGTQGYPINVWSGVYWSLDGGKTWRNALMPGHPADDANQTHPNRSWSCNSDPVVVFARDGTAYYSGLGIWGQNVPNPQHPCVQTGRSIWMMKSTDGGATWKDFSCVAGSTYDPAVGGALLDKQWFAVDGSNIYFTYVAFNPTEADFMFRRSTDGGRTWDPERLLIEVPTSQNPDAPLGGRQFTSPAVGPNGEVYITWHSFGADNGVYFTRSLDRGLTFEPPRRIAPISDVNGPFFSGGYRMSSYPFLAADGGAGNQSGNLYVIWSDAGRDEADVVLIRSRDGGQTWSDPMRINSDPPGALQFLPWLAVGPSGDLHALWLDNRTHGNATRLDALHRVSRDGGQTWEPELRVNAQPIETEACHHQNGSNFIGDYIGLAASAVAVHPLWPDGRGGKCNAVTATILR